MARKRMISPEFWHDPKVLKTKTHTAKLFMIGLFSNADDEGILNADLDSLILDIFAEAPDKRHTEAIKMIEGLEMAVRYKANKQEYFFLPNFYKHQRIDHPTPSKNPRPPQELSSKFAEYSKSIRLMFGEQSESNPRAIPPNIVKYSVVKPNLDESNVDNTLIDSIVSLWNSSLGDKLPKIEKLTEGRKQKLLARIKDYPKIEDWQKIFDAIKQSQFLLGFNDNKWICNFDFVIKNDTIPSKILEGGYKGKTSIIKL